MSVNLWVPLYSFNVIQAVQRGAYRESIMRGEDRDAHHCGLLRFYSTPAFVNKAPSLKYSVHPSFENIHWAWSRVYSLWVSFQWLITCTKIHFGRLFFFLTYITGYFYSLMHLTHLCNHTVSRNPDVPQCTSGSHALANICCKHQRLFVGFNVLAHLITQWRWKIEAR